MKHILWLLLISSFSIGMYSINFISDDEASVDPRDSVFDIVFTNSYDKRSERFQYYRSRSPYQNKMHDKKQTLARNSAREDKRFRQGDFTPGHPLEVVYLQRVSSK